MTAFFARAMALAGIIAVASFGPASAQRSWYVAPGGVDLDNECQDADAPCATIAYALTRIETNAAISGDTLYLVPGVYTESGLVLPRDVNLSGAGPLASIIQAATDASLATNRVIKVPLGIQARFEGLAIRNGRAPDGGTFEESGGAGGSGGGILNNGMLQLVHVHIVSNRAGNGGSGLYGGPGGDGGGIFNDGFISASNVVIAHNRSGDGGGGAQIGGRGGNGWGLHNSGVAELSYSSLIDNLGGSGGAGGDDGGAAGLGGIWNSGRLILFSSTVDGNTGGLGGVGTNGAPGAVSAGGGLWAASASTSVLTHVTLASNQAAEADAVFSEQAIIDIHHTLIGGTVTGAFFVAGPSLIEYAEGGAFDGDTNVLIVGLSPDFGLRDLFGGTTPVRRIKPLSPAVNAGDPMIADPPAVDQRGAPRIQGGRIDIGAYELSSSTSFVSQIGTDLGNECRDELNPCATIGHAVAQALPGDEILFLPGVVTDEDISLEKPLILRGLGIGASIWQAVSNRHLSVAGGVTCVVRDLTVRGGRAPDGADADDGASGGAILNQGVLWIARVAFEDNAAGNGGPDGGAGGRGGAIYSDGFLHIAESRFASNRAGQAGTDADGGAGGAIYNDAAAHIHDSLFIMNESGAGDALGAGGSGGAIFNAGLMSIARSAFVSNATGAGSPGGSGGGIYNEDTLGATNMTVSGNRCATDGVGGGIANPGFMTLAHATIANNAASDAGGFHAAGPQSIWGHVLIAENLADNNGPDAIGVVDSRGWNLLGDASGVTLTNILTGNVLNMDPGLDPLAFNGSPIPTHALNATSAARDAGNPSFSPPPSTDQRGKPRVIPPRIDIGAFEAPLLDSDGDGMPDYWEIDNGLDPFDPGATNVNAGADGDPDADHMSNFEEYIAGTSPTDASSVFRLKGIGATPTIDIKFPSVTGRLYTLQRASPGAVMTWTNLPGWVDLPGIGATSMASHTATDSAGAYRVTVRLPALDD